MNTKQKQQMRVWVNTWKEAGEALKEIKRQELRQYDYEKNFPQIDAMLQWAYEHRTPRETSGLVEQQRCFLKWRERLLSSQNQKGHLP